MKTNTHPAPHTAYGHVFGQCLDCSGVMWPLFLGGRVESIDDLPTETEKSYEFTEKSYEFTDRVTTLPKKATRLPRELRIYRQRYEFTEKAMSLPTELRIYWQGYEFTDRATSLPTEAFSWQELYNPWGVLILERTYSTIFWLHLGKEYSHVPTKVNESEFTDEITEDWGCDTPHIPPASCALHVLVTYSLFGLRNWIEASTVWRINSRAHSSARAPRSAHRYKISHFNFLQALFIQACTWPYIAFYFIICAHTQKVLLMRLNK